MVESAVNQKETKVADNEISVDQNQQQPVEEAKTDPVTQDQEEEKESLVMDFSTAFKADTRRGKKKKKGVAKKATSDQPQNGTDELEADAADDVNKDLEDENLFLADDSSLVIDEIPRNLTITQEQMAQRKVMDQRRWYCLARPQYPKSCGISSLVSCWNYLYSSLGVGSKRPISTEEALEVLGFKPPYQGVSFGSFTGNDTLILWFSLLNRYFGVKGDSRIAFKLHGKSKTLGIDKEQGLENLKAGLKSENKAYIYHCYNHYMCPVGYEMVPTMPQDAYKCNEEISEFKEWILIGEISKCYPIFHIKPWEELFTDIDCAFPRFYNIRKSEQGVQVKTSKAFTEGRHLGGNLHCLIEFERIDTPARASKQAGQENATPSESEEKKE